MAKDRKGARITNSTSFFPSPSPETDTVTLVTVVEGCGCSNRFWFYDGSIVIKVEDTLYKVHESLLRAHWPFFRNHTTLKGNYESIPMQYISSISKEEFELLLDFIYPTSCIPDQNAPRSTDDWVRILAASTAFSFVAARCAAITALTSVLSPVKRLRLGREHSVFHWIVPAFRELCERVEMLKLEEARELKLDVVLNISHAREMVAKGAEWDSDEVKVLFDQPRSIV